MKNTTTAFCFYAMCLTVFLTSILMPAKAIDFFQGTYKEALAKSEKENKPVLLYFTASWCGPCRYMAANIFPDTELSAMINANYIPLYLDVDKDGNELIYYKYTPEKGLGVPIFIFINSKEEVIKRHGSSMTLKQLKEFIQLPGVFKPISKAVSDSAASSFVRNKRTGNAGALTRLAYWIDHSNWQPGLQLGINRQHASPYESGFNTFRTGFNIGLFFERNTRHFVIRPAINFIAKGAINSASGQSLRLNYFEIPVKLGVNIFMKPCPIRLNLIPYAAYAAGGNRTGGGDDFKFGNKAGEINRFDYGIKTGISAKLGSFEFLAGYDFGLNDISNGAPHKIFNRGFYFEASVNLGQ